LTFCRSKQAAKSQQAKVAQQQLRQVQAQALTPAYVPPTHLAQFAQPQASSVGMAPPVQPAPKAKVTRVALYSMDEQEFKAWQTRTLDALEDAKARGEAYLAKRSARGVKTSTDIAMERDQLLFADLIEAVKELDILREWAEDNQTQHPSSNTGMMVPYDDGKLTP
jgi:hypothetical protein